MIQKVINFDDNIKEKLKEHTRKCHRFMIIHTEY